MPTRLGFLGHRKRGVALNGHMFNRIHLNGDAQWAAGASYLGHVVFFLKS
jgi:hypothetical protein